jgi:NAD(P)-dependent dehydrogenase (short-subunit alcohol dehydrogenase family)
LDTRETLLVLGGSGAVGSAAARQALRRGLRVVVTRRSGPPREDADGIEWLAYRAGDDGCLEPLAESVRERTLRAVLFAIGMPSSKRTIAETPPEEWRTLAMVNVGSLLHVLPAIMEPLRTAAGSLVVLSSDAAVTQRPTSGPYTATKAALQSVAVTLAREEAVNGVRVNVLAPSLIRSPMAEEVLRRKGVSDPEAHYRALPWGRPLDADEVAAACLAVALDPSWRYASGRVIPLTGPDG